MRQSIGTTFMLNFIILFIFLVFAFLAGTLSYYKAYRINNAIVNAIERYEGYNELSLKEINGQLESMGYEANNLTRNPYDISKYCPEKWKEYSSRLTDSGRYNTDYYVEGQLVDLSGRISEEGAGKKGYCIYYFPYDNNFDAYNMAIQKTDNYYTYGVLTYLQFQFPGLQTLLRIPVFSRTNRMYKFG